VSGVAPPAPSAMLTPRLAAPGWSTWSILRPDGSGSTSAGLLHPQACMTRVTAVARRRTGPRSGAAQTSVTRMPACAL
jgi:hypothetical protein